MIQKPRKFWMVYGEDQRAPSFRHLTKERAKAEAKRLALSHPEIKFFVLAAVDCYRADAPEVKRMKIDPPMSAVTPTRVATTRHPDDIPF